MPQDIDRYRVQELHAEGAAIVEVLPDEEFANEHLPGSISLPLGELKRRSAEQRLGKDRERPIVTYCQSVD